jgi:hypothetical protein
LTTHFYTAMSMQKKLGKHGVAMLLFLGSFLKALSGNAPNDSTAVVFSASELPVSVKKELYRTFDELAYVQALHAATDPIVVSNLTLADTVEEEIAYAQTLLEKVTSGNRFVESLDALSEVELPVGVVKTGGALDYSILVDRITTTTQGSILDVYVSIAFPQGDRLAFHGKIPLSKEGGIAGNAKVFLVGDHNLKLGGKTLVTIKGSKNTYVEFDCGGFKGMSIEALIQFSRDLIIPEDEKGNAIKDPDQRVKVSFTSYVQSLNDLMVGVNIPAFQVNGLDGFGFKVTEAFLDWSDLANPPGIEFPKDYPSPFVQAGQPLLWQGFYLQRLEVRFPPSFTKKEGDQSRIVLGVEKMILDDQGFTGDVFANNVLDAGDMSGWSYSLDHVELGFVANQLKGFALKGTISVPNLKKKSDNTATSFGYLASRSVDGNYLFSVSIREELRLPLFVADLTLRPGSSITVKQKEGKFYPTALLNGELTINVLGKGPKASFNGISFEGLRISTEDPHFGITAVGFGKEGQSQSVSKYPLSINNIMLKKEGSDRIGIGFDVTINIGGSSADEGFGGTAGLVVWGKRDVEQLTSAEGQVTGTKTGRWQFDKVELSGIGVSFKKAGVIEIAGMISFFEDDPIYGDGFKGSITGKIQVISLKVEALFGKTPEFRYWYADALVEFSSGLPLVPGFSAYGFGGGYYSKMKQSTDGSGSRLGTNASGITYVPDANTIGIKALVKFGATASQAPYNGDVMLQVMLNTHGGINSVTFSGNIVVLSPVLPGGLEKLKSLASAAVGGKGESLMKAIDGQISASVKILFDNENHVFHANMEIYINIVGGIVKGIGENNLAGWAVMHFAHDEWYVLIGTPDKPVGLELLWLLKIKSYFMVGKNLPGSPPPPQQVSEILGITADKLDYMRDLNAAESGFGFAFGLSLGIDTGDVSFLMFYGRFAAGIGADIMIKKYGDQYHCSGSDETIGINGWFANGQAYAYVLAKIGIKVHLRFYKGNYEILNMGAAAVMQAKGPNPFWLRGIVGGYYRILGGLVKGNCKFELTIGQECKVVGNSNPLENVNIIGDVSPVKGDTDVDVFNAPQAAFNIPIGETFVITDVEDRRRTFRGRLVEFSVMDGAAAIAGTVRWDDELKVAAFDSHDILPPHKELTAKVKITFEELANGLWKTVVFEGKEVEEIKETTFTTGTAPDYIPLSNVDISYPLLSQYNFYPKEYNQGFIQLKKGQPYLFPPGPDWIQSLFFTNTESQAHIETDVSYAPEEKRVHFDIPAPLQNNKVYKIDILNLPRQTSVLNANVQNVESKLSDTGDTLTTKKIEGDLSLAEAKSVYGASFRTSKFNTFTEKIQAVKFGKTLTIPAATGDMSELRAYMQGAELLDKYELEGIDSYDPLVGFSAILKNNPWYNELVYPLVYDGYPLLGIIKVERDTALLGLPPVRSAFLEQLVESPQLTPDANTIAAPGLSAFLHYDLMHTALDDYRSIQRQAANYVVDHPDKLTDRLNKILTGLFPFYRYGTYPVEVRYRIPGMNKTTTTYDIDLFNDIRD